MLDDTSRITRCWKQIIGFNDAGEPAQKTETKPIQTVVSMLDNKEPDTFVLGSGLKIVTDSRGTRVVQEYDDEADAEDEYEGEEDNDETHKGE